MNKHVISCLALTLLATNGFCQQVNDPQTGNLENAIIQTVQQIQDENYKLSKTLMNEYYTPMYTALSTLQRTDTQRMIEVILPTASMYNHLNQIDPGMAKREAQNLNLYFHTAYTLRTTLLELFEGNSVQDGPLTEHKNQTLKDFEKNLRINLLGGQEYVLNTMSVHNRIPTTLSKAYQTVTDNLKNTSKKTNQLPEGLTEFMQQFEYLNDNNPALAQEVIDTLFVYPQETGWGASTSFKNIFRQALIEFWAGGDGITFKTEEQLVKEYGDETGKLLFKMSNHIYKK